MLLEDSEKRSTHHHHHGSLGEQEGQSVHHHHKHYYVPTDDLEDKHQTEYYLLSDESKSHHHHHHTHQHMHVGHKDASGNQDIQATSQTKHVTSQTKLVAYAIALFFGLSIGAILWLTLFSREVHVQKNFLIPGQSYVAMFQAMSRGEPNAALNVVGNILMFVPLGFFAPCMHGLNWCKIAVLGFICSCGIEITQLVMDLGCFEVDDVINNTLGALLGYGIYQLLPSLHGCKDKVRQVLKQFVVVCMLGVVLGLAAPSAYDYYVASKMQQYATLHDRADGAKNLLVLKGYSGYVGNTYVYVEYQDDGSISIAGKADSRAWKLIGELDLAPGKYTFAGLQGMLPKTMDIELVSYNKNHRKSAHVAVQVGVKEQAHFTLKAWTPIRVYVGVYPGAEGNYRATPVLYKEE